MDYLLQISDNGLDFYKNTGKELVGNDESKVYYSGTILNQESLLAVIDYNIRNDLPLYQGIHGNYTIIYDSPNGEIYIFQDIMGGNATVYYTMKDGKYYISTSIKDFKQIGMKYRFNTSVADEFVYNGVIKTRDTLLCGVYKLLPGECIKIEAGEPSIIPMIRRKEEKLVPDIDALYEQEVAIIKEYVNEAQAIDDSICATLSGGYDSNLILHTVKQEDVAVSIFSCGGVRGEDESLIAQKICDHYKDIEFRNFYVNKNVLSEMKEIVWRLEGALYERGIFLQYVLASNLYKHRVKCILLGECADQVFNKNYYDNPSSEFIMTYITHPYELGSLLVLKKSNLMLSSFGIQGLYPFIDDRMIEVGDCTRLYNSESKEYQKKMCHAKFDSKVMSLIEKKPGSTALCTLFESPEDENRFIEEVKANNEFYKPDFRIVYRYDNRESELDYYLCLEYLKHFKEIFCEE